MLHCQSFPLPGKYHFRALKTIGQMTVWLDLVDDGKAVPSYNESVVLKVSRVSLGASSRPQTSPVKESQRQQVQQDNVQSPVSSPSHDQNITEDGSRSPKMLDKTQRRGSEKLISFDTFDDTDNKTPPLSKSLVVVIVDDVQ